MRKELRANTELLKPGMSPRPRALGVGAWVLAVVALWVVAECVYSCVCLRLSRLKSWTVSFEKTARREWGITSVEVLWGEGRMRRPSLACSVREKSPCVESALGFIARTFEYRSKDIILPLYKSLVRPHLEYAVQCWSPHYVKDITVLERVQRRATKLIPAIRNLPYSTRLQRLHLHSLELRRIRGQLIEVFKILNGFDEAENLLFRNCNSVTRNNGCKLRGSRFKTDIAKNFFSNRIVNAWNLLPSSLVSSDSINQFKNRLDKFFESDKFSDFSRICELKVT